MLYTHINESETYGLWYCSLADGFNVPISYKFVLSLTLAIVRYNNNITMRAPRGVRNYQ